MAIVSPRRQLSAALLFTALISAFLFSASPSNAANNRELVRVGMPFAGKWAWFTPAARPYDDIRDSHPAAHHTPDGGDWATDLYTTAGTDVRLRLVNATGKLSYHWLPSSTTCGESTKLSVSVDGVNVGWLYIAHLENAATSGKISNGMLLGKVAGLRCNPGAPGGNHIHIEFKNTLKHSCYFNHGQPGAKILPDGGRLGVLGSNNAGSKQACTTGPPTTTITKKPPNPRRSGSASFAFKANQPANFQCRRDGGAWAQCTSPKSYRNLAEGSHTFAVRATNPFGTDSTPAAYRWRIDFTAPNTTLTASPSNTSNSASASFAFNSTEAGSTFQCQLDGGAWMVCESPQAYTALSEGSHTFSVRATDRAGNTDATPATRTWQIDLTPPDTTDEQFSGLEFRLTFGFHNLPAEVANGTCPAGTVNIVGSAGSAIAPMDVENLHPSVGGWDVAPIDPLSDFANFEEFEGAAAGIGGWIVIQKSNGDRGQFGFGIGCPEEERTAIPASTSFTMHGSAIVFSTGLLAVCETDGVYTRPDATRVSLTVTVNDCNAAE